MSVPTITARGRLFALARMLDTCTVTRLTGSATDPETGVVTPTTPTIYTGKCRLRQAVVMDRPLTAGEAQRYIQHTVLSIPITAAALASDDTVTVTASALMPILVGRTWHVRALAGDSDMTAARYELVEVTS